MARRPRAAGAPRARPTSLHHASVLPSRDDVRAALPRAAQTAISAAVAWQICRWLGADRPVFAAIVPIVAIKGDPLAALNVSLGRLFGVVGGIALGIIVSDVGGANALTVALLIGAGLIAGLLIRIGGEPNSQVAVSALLVLAVATGAGAFGLERLWETAIGAAVTVVLAPFLWPPDPVRELERRLAAVATRVSDDIALTVALVGAPADAAARHLADVVEHTREATRLVDALGTAGRGLRLNPRRRDAAERLRRLVPRVRIAGDVAHGSRRLARDVAGLAAREDLADAWEAAAIPAQAAGEAVRATVRAALADAPTGGDRLRAEAALDRWRDLDTSAVAVVLRRDLRTLLEDAIPVAAAAARVP